MPLYSSKGLVGYIMLDSAGVLRRNLRRDAELGQKICQCYMSFIYLFRYCEPGLRKRQKTALVHKQVSVAFEDADRAADARL